MRPIRVVLTGATGFIGSAVFDELARYRDGLGERPGGGRPRVQVRVVGRRAPEDVAARADEWVSADLARPDTVRGVCADADVLLHMAALVGSDEAQCEAVNVRGTAALMDEAVRSGVGRIVHLSTAAVYGPGPHWGIAVNEVVPAPVSAASRTRLAGEEHALAAGAAVLRPGLVLGRGDRWVVPLLAELLDVVPALWDGGRGRLSVVAVDDLARLVVRLGLVAAPYGGPGVWHASHPDPVSTGELLRTLARHRVLPPPPSALPWDECVRLLRAAHTTASERQFALLARDHWYESHEVWCVADCSPGPGPLVRLADAAPWYRSALAARTAG
ncbi:NAD-dependent epimerase/dehydratase family protein [Streptomyces piniterrae]|uniref:NAD-dependent epimerase/dehydratase family protein n=1 Tax=Streptomyces piniterrae TaxID=2571125 RepID=A0A4U0NEW9_9ACTN|nr:NAD-dependent epimerase/dehydratase family protein [Streptomyces piniterrae]TJZ52112.1 NAD-dependent epimerase/dehydratase family protein [Streptomyces piniterrae]